MEIIKSTNKGFSKLGEAFSGFTPTGGALGNLVIILVGLIWVQDGTLGYTLPDGVYHEVVPAIGNTALGWFVVILGISNFFPDKYSPLNLVLTPISKLGKFIWGRVHTERLGE